MFCCFVFFLTLLLRLRFLLCPGTCHLSCSEQKKLKNNFKELRAVFLILLRYTVFGLTKVFELGNVNLVWASKIPSLSSISATSKVFCLFSCSFFFFFFLNTYFVSLLEIKQKGSWTFWLLLCLWGWWIWEGYHPSRSFLTGKQTRSFAQPRAKSSVTSLLRAFLASCSRKLSCWMCKSSLGNLQAETEVLW